MRASITVLLLLGTFGKTQAAPPESGKSTPASGVKAPPMPPQLDDTLFADAGTAKWAPVSSLPKGVQGALIGTDASNGGMSGWLKLPAGYHLPATWETHLSSYTVISGQLSVTVNKQKHTLGPGGYVVLTSKDKHELSCGSSECLLIVRHFGPPDMHWVNPADAPKTR
jgi:hypothetical protein